MLTYADATAEALDRLQGVGFEHGPSFVNHAPMAAEALACLGYADAVPSWVDHNLAVRHYHERPEPRWSLSPDDETDWRSALGDFSRVADWSAMFERELADQSWPVVLGRWWPRLLPGMSGVLTHGVIRTAHAVRSLAQASDDQGGLRTRELAEGLGYWAARYSAHEEPLPDDPAPARPDAALTALDELVADSSGHYVRISQGHPVPLIHAITGPAAVRLVVPHLPAEQHWQSYLAAHRVAMWMRSYFGHSASDVPDMADNVPPAPADLVAAAVELGDEHAIKLAEVAIRHNALAPDNRYAVASAAATRRLGGYPG